MLATWEYHSAPVDCMGASLAFEVSEILLRLYVWVIPLHMWLCIR